MNFFKVIKTDLEKIESDMTQYFEFCAQNNLQVVKTQYVIKDDSIHAFIQTRPSKSH